jgi:hypothetical protein
MLLEGDWILEDPSWDALAEQTSGLMPVLTPWSTLGDHAGLDVEMGVTESSRRLMRRCDSTDAHGWLASRDPDGALADALRSLGAYDDHCIDVREESQLMADAMRSQRIVAEVRDFSDPASSATFLADPDLARLARDVLELANG